MTKSALLLAALLLAQPLSGCAAQNAVFVQAEPARLELRKADFSIQGHRGARGLAPENTLPAFAKAIALGVGVLELDLAVTQDGELVISHDRRLSPDLTRDAAGQYVQAPGPLISGMSFAELQTYDVGQLRRGSDEAKEFPDQTAVPNTKVPKLTDVIDLVKQSGNDQIRLSMEIKTDPRHPDETLSPEAFAAHLVDVLHAQNFVDRVDVESFDWRALRAIQLLEPRLRTVYLTTPKAYKMSEEFARLAGFDLKDYNGSFPRAVQAAGGQIWSPDFHGLDRAQLAEAHALGLQVIAWTVNDAPTMTRLIDMGVDGIITDRPDRLRQCVENAGLRVPREGRADWKPRQADKAAQPEQPASAASGTPQPAAPRVRVRQERRANNP